MFYTHGNPAAILVTTTGTKHRETHKRFPDPHAALAWCIQHRAQFIYLPAVGTLSTASPSNN